MGVNRAQDVARPTGQSTRALALAAAMASLIGLIACQSPADHFTEAARDLGFKSEVLPGTEFLHVVYTNNGDTRSQVLHVYLGGDGTPWMYSSPSEDPTPRNPMALRLLALDRERVIYLGRPCYHGLATTPSCSSEIWTNERYSEVVVASMAAALRHFLDRSHVETIAWFGYSGGGVLSMLLAPRVPETAMVVTVAANLDVAAWAEHHGYDPLAGSLDPATQSPLPRHIHQRHYAGGKDSVVPPAVVNKGLTDPRTLVIKASYDHVCCWVETWPTILADVESALRYDKAAAF